jgi:TRAP-type C4-dicarboxylate transport system permease small subunit
MLARQPRGIARVTEPDPPESAAAAGLPRWGRRLRRAAEAVAALLLAIMFLAFVAQIAFRYLLDWPLGWTSELSIVAWLWLVLWGAAFVLREQDEIRFDILTAGAGRRARRVMGLLAAVGLIALYGASLPAAVDYVTFMKVQESSYLDIRFDWLFSIFLIFSVAIILRYLWLAWRALTGRGDAGARGKASGI